MATTLYGLRTRIRGARDLLSVLVSAHQTKKLNDMLRGLRDASSSWLGKTVMAIVMGVLIISFGVWGIADIFRGFGQSTLAKIGRTEISTEQFRQLYTDKLQELSRRFGRPLTSEQARTFGLDRQVLQQVVAEATLDEEARRMGLGQSDEAVIESIRSDSNFKGLSGTFDPERFAYSIRQFGFTEQRYIAEQRRVSLRREIASSVLAGSDPSKTQLDSLSRYQNEQRTIDYARLNAAQAGAIDTPSPEVLASYFDEHKPLFRAPEYRKIAVLSLKPEDLAKTIQVSDDDAKKVFELSKDALATPERRQVLQIPFPNIEEAKAARERIAAGLSFEDLAKERNLSPSDMDLGLVRKTAIDDPQIANAAFSLPLNEVSEPVKGTLTTALLKVTKIDPGKTAVYEDAADAIKRRLAQERARSSFQDLRNKIEDERGGGANISETAQKLGLKAVTIDAVDRSGRGADGKPIADLPQGVDVISAAFASDVGVDNDPLNAKDGEVWFDVLGVTPSRERPLDEVKDQAAARWKDDQIATRLRAKATEMTDKLNGGAPFADVASATGTSVQTTTPFKRSATVNGLPDKTVTAAFATAKDAAGQTDGLAPGEFVVFKVKDITIPPADLQSDDAKKLQEAVQRNLGDEQIGEYLAKLETDIGVSINESAFATATGAGQSNQ